MVDTHDDDFLDGSVYDSAPAHAHADPGDGVPAQRRLPTWLTTGAWLVVGLVVGAVVVAVVHSSSSASAANRPIATAGQGQAAAPGAANGFGGPGGGFGFDGEQHVSGTLTAVDGSSLTVKSASGTATYTIDASTELVKDGQRVSSLSAMSVGDSVIVHAYPANGTTRVERVIDGLPQGGGFGGPPGGDPDGDRGTGTGTGTTDT